MQDFNKKINIVALAISVFMLLYPSFLTGKINASNSQMDRRVMFVGETGSGHTVVMDGPPDHGGRNMGVRPMEMLLLGLGGCSSFDVVQILQKGRNDFVKCVTEVSAERVDAVPSVFSKIHLHFIVTGHDLKASAVERAVKLSAEKYCSASIMLSKAVEITHDFEVIEV